MMAIVFGIGTMIVVSWFAGLLAALHFTDKKRKNFDISLEVASIGTVCVYLFLTGLVIFIMGMVTQ